MTQKRIFLCLSHMSGQEMKFIQEAFDTNWVVPLGPNVNGFEKDLESFMGQQKRIVALSSGTAAVHLALIACGVKAGDEVIVQTFTFCASSHPITYLGAKPVFVDSESDTWNMSPELLEEAIKDRIAKTGRKPKAIVPVYLYGMPAKIDEILSVAERYDIPVVEDAAEGFGSRYDRQMVGTFGRYGVLSFNGNKMITTSGGGALVCPDGESYNRVMYFATQARHHQHIAQLYREAFKDVEGIDFHDNPDERTDSNFWLNTITIAPGLKVKGQENAYKTIVKGAVGGAAGVVHQASTAHTDCEPNVNVEAMRLYLDRAGIESRPLWKPMHRQPVYQDAPAYLNGVSEELFHCGLCLPSGPMVTDEDVARIIHTIKDSVCC